MRLGLFALFKFFKTSADAMTKLHLLLAQAQPAAPSGASAPGGGPPLILIGYGLLMVALYFFLIAPQNKKRKELEKMISELKAGDEVVTSGGIYGTITSVKDDRFVVRIGDNNAKVEVGKGFISTVIKKTDAA
jgi:preprotein translocase subunit YajC